MKQWAIFLLVCSLLTSFPAVSFGAGSARKIQDGTGALTKEAAKEEAGEEDSLKLYARSAVLMDGDSGRILYGKEEDIARPMASTTKIMTCILALELGDTQDTVTASSEAASQPKVHLGVKKGEEYKLEDLLYALMLESYNDAAVMIAEHIGGSQEGFADLMNKKARALGCENTYFITPNGLDGVETDQDGRERIHSTTASDLALIMRYCISQSPKKEEFLKITQTQNYYFSELSGKRSFSCNNHNAFLNMMDGVLSGKTGFTGGAGYSYVGAMENQGRTYIIALLGCGWPPHKTYKWSDARTLYTYGLDHYEKRDVFCKKQYQTIPVRGGPSWEETGGGMDTNIFMNLSAEEMHLEMLLKEGEEVLVSENIPSILDAPVREGQMIGSVDYSLEGEVVKSYPLYAGRTIEKATFEKAAAHIWNGFLIW